MIEFIKKLSVTIAILITVCSVILGWIKLPKKVEAVETKTQEVDNKVEELADNMNIFITEQRTLEKSRDRREELMLELIRGKDNR